MGRETRDRVAASSDVGGGTRRRFSFEEQPGSSGACSVPAKARCYKGRAAIVAISASDCRIDGAIHESLAIEAGDTEPTLTLGEAEPPRPAGA